MSGAAVALAAALVWYFRPEPELPLLSAGATVRAPPAAVVRDSASRVSDAETRAVSTLSPAEEPVDATWAPGAEADLLARFAEMPGLTLLGLQVECRSTMCRLELMQPSGAPAVEGGSRPFNILLDSIGLEPRWMMAIGDRSGPMRSVAYLWRVGFAPKEETGQPQETD